MSMRVYLSKLELYELRAAREIVDELIAQKEGEPQVVVWEVRDRDAALSARRDYMEAAEELMHWAEINAKAGNVDPHDGVLRLVPQVVPESEAELLVMPRHQGEPRDG